MKAGTLEVRLPQVIDPETGLPETVGNGRVAVIRTGLLSRDVVSRLVVLPEIGSSDPDVLDELTAAGTLRNS